MFNQRDSTLNERISMNMKCIKYVYLFWIYIKIAHIATYLQYIVQKYEMADARSIQQCYVGQYASKGYISITVN